jgi:hypothetical protein
MKIMVEAINTMVDLMKSSAPMKEKMLMVPIYHVRSSEVLFFPLFN